MVPIGLLLTLLAGCTPHSRAGAAIAAASGTAHSRPTSDEPDAVSAQAGIVTTSPAAPAGAPWIDEQGTGPRTLVAAPSAASTSGGARPGAYMTLTCEGPGIVWVVEPGRRIGGATCGAGALSGYDIPGNDIDLGRAITVTADATTTWHVRIWITS